MNTSFLREQLENTTRRHFLKQCPLGLGGLALAMIAEPNSSASPQRIPSGMAPQPAKTAPRAKQVIFLHMAGGPSQLEMFDHKPELDQRNGEPCPEEFFKGQRFAFIKGHPKLLGNIYRFSRHGESGIYFSELLPHLASIADDLTFVRSMTTEQFNHAPAQLLMHTGSQLLGNPAIGAWACYGLGTLNQNLPGFVALVSGGNSPDAGKSIWGNGFLPGIFQGTQCRCSGDPILYVQNPTGMDRQIRRDTIDAINDLNRFHADEFHSPETLTRIQQYELAFRMQVTVPEVMDISREPKSILEMYGANPGQISLANNCLLARRLIEQGVRFVQLFDWGWDGHGTGVNDDLVHQLPKKCQEMDRPVTALIQDLKARGLLEDTLVIWGGEFGRTSMMEARNGSTYLGRDHHPHAFTMFFAGGGMKPGFNYGETDDFGYHVTCDEMPVKDLHATILHLLGLDPYHLTYSYLGLNQRLIGPSELARVHDALFS